MAEKDMKFFSLKELLDSSTPFDGEVSRHVTVTTTIPNFSFCTDQDFVCREYECDDEDFELYFEARFYPDGYGEENKGFVSVYFIAGGGLCTYPIHFTLDSFTCRVSLIDAYGNQRFPQSFTYDPDSNDEENCPMMGLDKFRDAKFLLSDPSEYLPGGSLKLSFEIDYKIQQYRPKFSNYDFFGKGVEKDGKHYYELLPCFEQDFVRISTFHKDIVEALKSGPVLLPSEEKKSWELVFLISKGGDLKIKSLSEICELYVLADKYDVLPEQILPTCRELLVSILTTVTTPEIFELVNESFQDLTELCRRYKNDDGLEDILAMFSRLRNGFETGEASSVVTLGSVWSCELVRSLIHGTYFLLRKMKSVYAE